MKSIRFSQAGALLLAVAIVLVFGSLAAACPNCKDTLASNGEGGNLVAGYYYSILFMMGMPFAIIGTFGFCMYRAVCRARAEEASRATSSDAARELIDA